MMLFIKNNVTLTGLNNKFLDVLLRQHKDPIYM